MRSGLIKLRLSRFQRVFGRLGPCRIAFIVIDFLVRLSDGMPYLGDIRLAVFQCPASFGLKHLERGFAEHLGFDILQEQASTSLRLTF